MAIFYLTALYGISYMNKETSFPFNDQRVMKYQLAESLCPNARELELLPFKETIVDCAGTALEIGSGTGFVTQVIADAGLVVDTIDYAFKAPIMARQHFEADVKQGIPNMIEDRQYDLIVSHVCLHHVVDNSFGLPEQLAFDLTKVSSSSAILVIQDVPNLERATSQLNAVMTASFFINVVDRFSYPKHNGIYLDLNSVSKQMTDLGWREKRCFINQCNWRFPNVEMANDYVFALFNLDVTHKPTISSTISEHIRPSASGTGVELMWGLDCLIMEKN